jgi:putative solute:sodium symporter small subunit
MMTPASTSEEKTYWKKMRVLTFSLLGIWSGASFSIIFFARELSGLSLFGWPVSFYMAAQGSILIYLLLIALYAIVAKKLDAASATSLSTES